VLTLKADKVQGGPWKISSCCDQHDLVARRNPDPDSLGYEEA
jgi:hypothetical protein